METPLDILVYISSAILLAAVIFAFAWKPCRGKGLFCTALLLHWLYLLIFPVVRLLNELGVDLPHSAYEILPIVSRILLCAGGTFFLGFAVVTRNTFRTGVLTPPRGDSVGGLDPQLAPMGIGGWLVLPAIGLILSTVLGPIMFVLSLVALQELPSDRYVVYFGVSILMQVGLYIFLLVALVCFFGRRRSAPGIMIGLMVADFAASVLLILVAVGMDAEELVVADAKGAMRSLLAAAIWIPYFRVSKRVKATFTRDSGYAAPGIVPPARGNAGDMLGTGPAGAIPLQAAVEAPDVPVRAGGPRVDVQQDRGVDRPALGLIDCPHCGVCGMLPMEGNLCPNCKRPI